MDQANFKLHQIGYVMLGVRELPRSVAFYRDKLGLAIKFQIPGFAFLDGGGVTLALAEPLARNNPQLVGGTEVVFSVEDVTAA